MRISDWSSDVCSSDLSFRWQRWQERALNSGPRPSAEVVDDGDVTQRRRNRPLPILKSSSRLKLMLAELCEKALALTACCEVVAPPGSGSNFSGRLKSVVGAITASMRARSSGVLCSAVGPAAKAAGPTSSDERRVGKGCVGTCESRWSPDQ